MKTSEKLISVLCDAEMNVCIEGSATDRKILGETINEVIGMEKTFSHPQFMQTLAHRHREGFPQKDICAVCGLDIGNSIHI